MIYIDFTTGEDQTIGHFTIEDATGAAADADTLPTVQMWDRVRIDDWAPIDLVPVVVPVSTGYYQVYMPGASLLTSAWMYAPFWPLVVAVVGGTTKKIPLTPVDSRVTNSYGVVSVDVLNTATVFKVSIARGPLLMASDDATFALVTFVSGSLAGQVAEVDSYNSITGFLTLKRALTAAPSTGDVFRLINS